MNCTLDRLKSCSLEGLNYSTADLIERLLEHVWADRKVGHYGVVGFAVDGKADRDGSGFSARETDESWIGCLEIPERIRELPQY